MVNPTAKSPHVLIRLVYLFFASFSCFWSSSHGNSSDQKLTLVGDTNSPFGRMMSLCINMAITDFYSGNPHYKTRLQLSTKNTKTLLEFNLAILESAKRGEVVGILQRQGSSEEAFAAALGESPLMPIISLTARTSIASLAESNYLVRTTLDNAVQAEALAVICQKFEWTKVVILYEDTGDGNQFLSHIIKAFQDIHIEMARMNSVPTSAEDSYIMKELHQLKEEPTKVFVVHMNPALGTRLFEQAEKAGMMSEGYAWIITDNLSIFMDSMNFNRDDSMDGVLGIRPYAFASKNLEDFQKRWKSHMLANITATPIMELNIYGLWAYDAITALAMAMEETGPVNSSSSYGPRLLSKLLSTKFRGLTGNFQLVAGKLKPSAFEIFNIIGNGERRVGFWTPERGIVRELSAAGGQTNELRKIMWPGDSVIPPFGGRIPATGNLRVGIPCKPGFKEYVNEAFDPINNQTNATGFAIDIFLATLKVLPFPVNYEYHCYNISISQNQTYDTMLEKIPKEYDMVVGDTTIWAPRTKYVDFSLPYSESGVSLVVRNRKPFDMWIFIRPLRWDLWLAIIIACIFMGIALRILERRGTNTDEQTIRPSPSGPGLIHWSPIAILAFPERNMVSNKWSLFALVCWLFMAFILMQSFTASLSAILTVDQIKFAFSEDYYVGYHEGSFMRNFLIEQLHISESRLRVCRSLKEFHEAMSKGSKNGGVDAIFDVVPYVKIFLKTYEFQYRTVGPTYRTDGYGFAFPKGSPLVSYFSRAILNVTQGPEMSYLEQKNFGPGYSSQDPMSSVISQGTSSLTLKEFAGLFLTVGSLTLIALFCSETSIGCKISNAAGHLIQNGCFGSRKTHVHSMADTTVDGEIPDGGGSSSCELDSANGASPRHGIELEEMGMDDVVVVFIDDDVARVENHGATWVDSMMDTSVDEVTTQSDNTGDACQRECKEIDAAVPSNEADVVALDDDVVIVENTS